MIKITPDTTLKDAMVNPMAKDVIEKLFLVLRLPADMINKGFVGKLKFKSLTAFTAGLLDKKTVQQICDMLNLEKDEVITDEGEMQKNGGKKRLFIRFIHALFATATVTE